MCMPTYTYVKNTHTQHSQVRASACTQAQAGKTLWTVCLATSHHTVGICLVQPAFGGGRSVVLRKVERKGLEIKSPLLDTRPVMTRTKVSLTQAASRPGSSVVPRGWPSPEWHQHAASYSDSWVKEGADLPGALVATSSLRPSIHRK